MFRRLNIVTLDQHFPCNSLCEQCRQAYAALGRIVWSWVQTRSQGTEPLTEWNCETTPDPFSPLLGSFGRGRYRRAAPG